LDYGLVLFLCTMQGFIEPPPGGFTWKILSTPPERV